MAGFFAISPKLPLNINRGEYKLGLDLQGGVELVLEADMKDVPAGDRDKALEGSKAVIDNRVNALGVSEPVIQTSKIGTSHRIIVELPGIKDLETAVRVVGSTAQLNFWEYIELEKEATPSARRTDLTGNDLKRASVTFDPNTGKPQVTLEFSNDGAKKFAEITKRNVGKIVPITLDNIAISTPTVNEPILTGDAVITGDFAVKEAKSLSIQLNAGALPVPLKILKQRTTPATLGSEQLAKILVAGAVGFAAVAIFMILFYRVVGFFAVLALIVYALIVLAIFKLIPVTLTLAGIAGFILSVGMAVDANILIFERFREEVRWGKPKNFALEAGFKRAWTSIRDSNISSLITCAILFQFGTGVVRGFALTLAIGILISMFSAIVVTRTFLRIIYR